MRAFRVILQGGSSPAIEALSRSRVTTSYLVAFLFAQKPLATSRTIIYNSPNALASRTLSRTPPRVVGQAAVPRLASIRLPSVKALRQAILLAAMTRTTSLKTQLRTNAEKLTEGEDCILDDEETTGDGTCPVQVGPDVSGAVVDRRSMKGRVVVTGGGERPQVITTGPEETGEPYTKIRIRDGQTCVIYGYSTALYYRPPRQ